MPFVPFPFALGDGSAYMVERIEARQVGASWNRVETPLPLRGLVPLDTHQQVYIVDDKIPFGTPQRGSSRG